MPYKPNSGDDKEDFNMDLNSGKPASLEEEIMFMKDYFEMEKREKMVLREKMARRVREFRIADVWVVCIVGWGLVWCEWRRREGRSELWN